MKGLLGSFSCWVVLLLFRPYAFRLGDRVGDVRWEVHIQDRSVREGWSSDCPDGARKGLLGSKTGRWNPLFIPSIVFYFYSRFHRAPPQQRHTQMLDTDSSCSKMTFLNWALHCNGGQDRLEVCINNVGGNTSYFFAFMKHILRDKITLMFK